MNTASPQLWGGCLIVIFTLITPQTALSQVPPSQSSKAAETRIMVIQGTVEILRAGFDTWQPAQTNQILRPGDRVRTGQRSRAELRLSNLAVLPVSESSALTIRAPLPGANLPILDFGSGKFSVLSRDKPLNFNTRLASGATRGTEFHLRVGEDGGAVLTVLEGEVDFGNDLGQVALIANEQAEVEPGKAPRKTAVLNAVNIIQWTLYYPAVLDPDELNLSQDDQTALAPSLAAYRGGDLLQALAHYPAGHTAASNAARLYLAALVLSVGGVEEAEKLLNQLPQPGPQATPYRKLADALRTLIAAVKFQPSTLTSQPSTSSEWLAKSYYHQSRSNLPEALEAGRAATDKSPNFGFAWARVAELQFSFGRTKKALAALDKALQLAPRHPAALALKGFVLAADGKVSQALDYFDQAIAIDGALGHAWLGRGLCRIRKGQTEIGREDLQMAAALEPQRSLFRSYLGKAFANLGDFAHARQELDRAKTLDANDPTPPLYSALLNRQQNRLNEAVRDLEHSSELNNNRSVFRSQLLLDQDRAVRSANLAAIYQEAGLTDVGVREASRALSADYANFSAHLFLANSFSALADPRQANLRYETPAVNELLLANLLAPVGAGLLSQNISQQEYARFFEQNHFGAVSGTEYSSRGDWLQYGSQYGRTDQFSYALDFQHRSENGQRPNAGFSLDIFDGKFKEKLSPRDSLLLEMIYLDDDSGDVTQNYFNQGTQLRLKENQEPILLAGYHHEWSPGAHTLLLFGRLIDSARLMNPAQPVTLLARDASGQIVYAAQPGPPAAALNYRTELEIYSAELQQICQSTEHTLVLGTRFQQGNFDTMSALGDSSATEIGTTTTIFSPFPPGFGFPPYLVSTPATRQDLSTDFQRLSVYGYNTWHIHESLDFTAGASYDRLDFPANHIDPPITEREAFREKVSPKAGLVWSLTRRTTLRGSFTRSLGGASLDQSVRLEPTQVGGFNQSYRSLISEAVAGPQSGPEFDTFGLGLDHKFPTGTYFGIDCEWLNSGVRRTIGAFDLVTPLSPSVPSSTRQDLDYRERDVLVTLNQLLGDYFSVGARYRVSDADLSMRMPEVPSAVTPLGDVNIAATLHQTSLYVLVNHPGGFFAEADSLWTAQSNRRDISSLPGDDFWQHNILIGYRFPRRAAELRLGLLNLSDTDYRLYPLNFFAELPRKRTVTVSLRFNF